MREEAGMARRGSGHPTDAELEILKVLWDAGPCELGRVVSGLGESRGAEVATTTVATTLKVMLQKELVIRDQGPKGYLWGAAVGREETSAGMLRKLLDRVFDGSAGRLVARLVEDGSISQADRDEIRRLLDGDGARPKGKKGGKG